MAVRYVILLRRTCRPAVRLGARGGGYGAVLASAWMGVRGEGRGIPHPARRAREEDGADPYHFPLLWQEAGEGVSARTHHQRWREQGRRTAEHRLGCGGRAGP